jgi:hypothetical protein
MDEDIGADLKWGVRKRLEFIEFRLFWDGRLNRSDLQDVFGLSHQQASTDFKTYQSLAPNNLSYDHTHKAFVRTANFLPVLMGESSNRYLLQVVAVKSGWMNREDTWFDQMPPLNVVALQPKRLDLQVVLSIVDAIRNKTVLEIDYRSMTGTPEEPRTIAPHGISYSAGRWYVRAWSEGHNDFRDYNLWRIQAARPTMAISQRSGYDYEWAQKINLKIGPNPELPDERRRAVVAEYEMVDGIMEVPVRLSLSFYLMSEQNLDVEPGKLSPFKQQLVLLNRQDVEDARRLARQMSKEALARGEA